MEEPIDKRLMIYYKSLIKLPMTLQILLEIIVVLCLFYSPLKVPHLHGHIERYTSPIAKEFTICLFATLLAVLTLATLCRDATAASTSQAVRTLSIRHSGLTVVVAFFCCCRSAALLFWINGNGTFQEVLFFARV